MQDVKPAKIKIPIYSEIQELESGRKFVSKVWLVGELIQRKLGFVYYKSGNCHYKVKDSAGMVS